MEPKTIAIVGGGARGRLFANLIAEMGHIAKVVAIAEPRPDVRQKLAATHNIAPDHQFADWQSFCVHPRLADGVIVATMDREHAHPAVACLDKGYHLLLEKPMGVTLDESRGIEAAQRRSGTFLAVAHSLRYASGFRLLRDLVSSGALGRVMTVEHVENVGIFHQAHAFVRGNWGIEGRATFMLLAKSCHDLDYLSFLIDKPCLAVSSYGSLSYFRRENAPVGSTDRCTDGCAVESTCPFSAIKQYVRPADKSYWWRDVLGMADSPYDQRLNAIANSPYGRCVWRCDNDVVDHQVVALQFAEDVTATFTMSAFSEQTTRRTHVHGTLGEAIFENDQITMRTFANHNTQTITVGKETGSHGGGDYRVLRSWLEAMHSGNPSCIASTAQDSLASHTIAFAAERSRREGRTVHLAEM